LPVLMRLRETRRAGHRSPDNQTIWPPVGWTVTQWIRLFDECCRQSALDR
jgi:hypothetical protein